VTHFYLFDYAPLNRPVPMRIFISHLATVAVPTMVISSHVALNKVDSGATSQLNQYISQVLAMSTGATDPPNKPLGLHFVVKEKIFRGTNMKFFCCPVQLLLEDASGETKLCQPMWTDKSLRAKVNRKVKFGTQKRSVIRLVDFKVVVHPPAPAGYVILIRSYDVVKKDVDEDAYERWLLEP
jgi:hypothetical protein